MRDQAVSRIVRVLMLLLFITSVAAQDPTSNPSTPTSSPSPSPTNPPPQSSNQPSSQSKSQSSSKSSSKSGNSPAPSPTTSKGKAKATNTSANNSRSTTPPDVLLRIPELSVGRIELDVDNLRADINLAAEIANIVTLNVGVQVGIEKVNITIADVNAELELIIRLGKLVEVVNRTLASLDLNPLLINLLNEVGDVVDSVVGAVDGLLGSILQGNSKINFLIDNLGNIVQEVVGEAGGLVSSIVGNYQSNMTFTGVEKSLGNGLTQKTYKYDALGSLVNVITNTLGQVVQAVVIGKDNNQQPPAGGGGGSSSSSAAAPSSTSSQAPKSTGG